MLSRRDILRILPLSFGVTSLGGFIAYRSSAFASEGFHDAIRSDFDTPIQENPSNSHPKRIKVIGIGSGGVQVVSYMMNCGLKDLEFVCADTDAKTLLKSKVPNIVQIGPLGLGAAQPSRGRVFAEHSVNEVREALAGSDVLFVTACLGLGAGSGASPVIARTAKEMGMLTIGFITMPFEWEGRKRARSAEHALAELAIYADWLIVLHSDKLFDLLGDDMTQEELLLHIDNALRDAVDGMAKLLNSHDDINISLDEASTVIGKSGHPQMDALMVITPGRS